MMRLLELFTKGSGVPEQTFHDEHRHPRGTFIAAMNDIGGYHQWHRLPDSAAAEGEPYFSCAHSIFVDNADIADRVRARLAEPKLPTGQPLSLSFPASDVWLLLEDRVVPAAPPDTAAVHDLYWSIYARPLAVMAMFLVRNAPTGASEAADELGRRMGCLRQAVSRVVPERSSTSSISSVFEYWWPTGEIMRAALSERSAEWSSLRAFHGNAAPLMLQVERFS